jgi:hypothetical protein
VYRRESWDDCLLLVQCSVLLGSVGVMQQQLVHQTQQQLEQAAVCGEELH